MCLCGLSNLVTEPSLVGLLWKTFAVSKIKKCLPKTLLRFVVCLLQKWVAAGWEKSLLGYRARKRWDGVASVFELSGFLSMQWKIIRSGRLRVNSFKTRTVKILYVVLWEGVQNVCVCGYGKKAWNCWVLHQSCSKAFSLGFLGRHQLHLFPARIYHFKKMTSDKKVLCSLLKILFFLYHGHTAVRDPLGLSFELFFKASVVI